MSEMAQDGSALMSPHPGNRHLCRSRKAQKIGISSNPEKGAAGPWGKAGRSRTRSGDGEGWGRDRVRVTFQRDVAVAVAGRGSPSETHTLGSNCDWRLTKR